MKLKKIIQIVLMAALIFCATTSYATSSCKAMNAKVVSIMPWESGHIFINLNISNDCGCSIPTRFAFHKDDLHAKTFLAQALTAFSTQSLITIYGEAGCTVHSNTSHIYTMILGGGS